MQFQPFTQDDWYSYAGAEVGPSGQPPLIANAFASNGNIVDAVADYTGITVFVYADSAHDNVLLEIWKLGYSPNPANPTGVDYIGLAGRLSRASADDMSNAKWLVDNGFIALQCDDDYSGVQRTG